MNAALALAFVILMAISGTKPNGAWLLAGIVAAVLLYRLGAFRKETWIDRDSDDDYSSLDIRDGLGSHVARSHTKD